MLPSIIITTYKKEDIVRNNVPELNGVQGSNSSHEINFFLDDNGKIVHTMRKLSNEQAKSISFKLKTKSIKKKKLPTSGELEMSNNDETEDEYDGDEDKDDDEDGVDLEVHYSNDDIEMVHTEDDDNEVIMEDTEEIQEDLTLGMFVIVEYEGELFPGKVLKY